MTCFYFSHCFPAACCCLPGLAWQRVGVCTCVMHSWQREGVGRRVVEGVGRRENATSLGHALGAYSTSLGWLWAVGMGQAYRGL
jgi:hypothetical protein